LVKRKRTEKGKASLKSTKKEKMLEEAMENKFGEGDLDAHKGSMALLSNEEVDAFKKEQAKLLKNSKRPCSSCGNLGHWDKKNWLCPMNARNLKNVEIEHGREEDDWISKKKEEKKKAAPKKKTGKKIGIAALTVPELKVKPRAWLTDGRKKSRSSGTPPKRHQHRQLHRRNLHIVSR
jgi:hypothetical protein